MEATRAIEAIVARLRENTPARVGVLMHRERDKVLRIAKSLAPVRTGRWRDSLRAVDRVIASGDVGNIRSGISVGDGIDYERYVKFGQNDVILAGKSAWQELVRKPMKEAAPRIVRDAGPELLRAARGG